MGTASPETEIGIREAAPRLRRTAPKSWEAAPNPRRVAPNPLRGLYKWAMGLAVDGVVSPK